MLTTGSEKNLLFKKLGVYLKGMKLMYEVKQKKSMADYTEKNRDIQVSFEKNRDKKDN